VLLLALRGPGDVLGDAAAVSGWPRTATVETLQSVEALQIYGEQFVACLDEHPTISVALLKNLCTRERESEHSRYHFASSDVMQRVAALLLRLADMHGRDSRNGTVVDMPLTQQDIANSVGASRRAVARALVTLRDRGFVMTGRARFVIHDRASERSEVY
jgi:CRP/FNR family transcriptional regulator, cyclic AMP receptor protein